MADDGLLIGKTNDDEKRALRLLPRMANRHGLIAGATGTGKTVTLQVISEQLSRAGVPVFVADVKGDLSGLSQPGREHPKIDERVAFLGLDDYRFEGTPVVFWDVFAEQGHPIRATVSDMGPLLLARLLDLNDTQEAILHLIFKLADDEGLMLLDLKDLRSMVAHVGDNAKELRNEYGNISPASIGAIQRALLVLEEQGGDLFFGEPALDLQDFMRTALDGRGIVNLLAASQLIGNPKIYATMLLWLLAELFEELPEVGDPDKPKLVFFFDEAHLLFEDAPKALIDKVEQVVRLIRSKGVGVFFVTQNPLDIPDDVLGQLGNRIQHALRAYTARDQKAVRAAAETFRANPALETEQVITELGVGEALVSFLDSKGVPGMVQQTLIRPPYSRIGPASEEERSRVRAASPVAQKYDQPVDRESAYEILTKRTERRMQEAEEQRRAEEREAAAEKAEREAARACSRSSGGGRRRQSIGEALAKSAARSIGSSLGRQIVRGILGAILKGR
jgi:DNA helicase HerA-like ATPase